MPVSLAASTAVFPLVIVGDTAQESRRPRLGVLNVNRLPFYHSRVIPTAEYAGHIALEEQVEVMKYQARILEAIGKTFERGVKIITKVIYGEVEKSLINTADDYVGVCPCLEGKWGRRRSVAADPDASSYAAGLVH